MDLNFNENKIHLETRVTRIIIHDKLNQLAQSVNKKINVRSVDIC